MYKWNQICFTAVDQRHWLTGRYRMYHGTAIKKLPSIYKTGLKGKYANDPNSKTRILAGTREKGNAIYKSKELDDLVYVNGHNKSGKQYSDNFGDNSTKMYKKLVEYYGGEDKVPKHYSQFKDPGKTLKISIPFDRKPTFVINPEYKDQIGHKTPYEFAKAMGETDENWRNNKHLRKVAKNSWKYMKDNGKVIKGDIAPEFIKGHKGYKRVTLGEILRYQFREHD